MKKSLLILGLAVLGAVGLVKWMGGGGDDNDASDAGLVFDRIWIDQLPTKAKDTANLFAALTEEPLGIFQYASQWKGGFELFRYQASGQQLNIVYPQTDEKEKVKARAWKCDEHDMDYCLELTGASRGVKRYRSKRGWELDGATRPEQIIDRAMSMARAAR
jgi:hypothetical protein